MPISGDTVNNEIYLDFIAPTSNYWLNNVNEWFFEFSASKLFMDLEKWEIADWSFWVIFEILHNRLQVVSGLFHHYMNWI